MTVHCVIRLVAVKEGPPVVYGKNPTDLPNQSLSRYENGHATIVGCYTGPNGGLTAVKRAEKHLSVPDSDDIDFIDTATEENECKRLRLRTYLIVLTGVDAFKSME